MLQYNFSTALEIDGDLNPLYGPGTFRELLRRLRCDEYPRHRDLLEHIETAAMLSANMRQACEADSQIDPAELLQFIAKLEGVATRGWYTAGRTEPSGNISMRRRRMIQNPSPP